MSKRLLIVPVLVMLSTAAHAGRRPFIWPYDVETVPAKSVELEQWIWDREEDGGQDLASLWWAPVIGVADGLELAFPIEFFWHETGGRTNLETYGADLRWRLPKLGDAVTPLLRLGIKRLDLRHDARAEGDLVLAVDAGRFHFVLDGGFMANTDGTETDATLGAGISFTATPNVRFAVESFSTIVISSELGEQTWSMAGPDLAFTFGRMWITAGVLIGITDTGPRIMPRLIWAIKF